jgi:hypothetical protein
MGSRHLLPPDSQISLLLNCSFHYLLFRYLLFVPFVFFVVYHKAINNKVPSFHP